MHHALPLLEHVAKNDNLKWICNEAKVEVKDGLGEETGQKDEHVDYGPKEEPKFEGRLFVGWLPKASYGYSKNHYENQAFHDHEQFHENCEEFLN